MNQGGELVDVHLTRDKDGSFIPYTTIYSVTLIALLRIGLVETLRQRFYKQFVHLPLYEDMAPWNIVMQGPRMDYIDYDTRDRTFDAYVQRAYQTLSVLMNYKRTVKDFAHCGDKASTEYGFSWVSECVKCSKFTGPCPDSDKPVPCSTGTCVSDYVTCLRLVVEHEVAPAADAEADLAPSTSLEFELSKNGRKKPAEAK